MSQVPLAILGRGVVWCSEVDPQTNRPLGWYPVLSTKTFTISVASEKLPHYNYSTRGRPKDASVRISTDYTLSWSVDDMNVANVARFFGASGETVTQAAATGIAINIANPRPGITYFLGEGGLNVMGDKNISDVVLTAGATPLVVELDYTVDLVNGSVTFVEGGAVTAATPAVTGTYNREQSTFSRFLSAAEDKILAIRFISDNNGNAPDAADAQEEWLMPRVAVSPDGGLDLISDDWRTLTYSGEILKFGTRAEIYRDGRPVTV